MRGVKLVKENVQKAASHQPLFTKSKPKPMSPRSLRQKAPSLAAQPELNQYQKAVFDVLEEYEITKDMLLAMGRDFEKIHATVLVALVKGKIFSINEAIKLVKCSTMDQLYFLNLYFSGDYEQTIASALFALVMDVNFPLTHELALEEIKGLNPFQLKAIAALYCVGLKGDELRSMKEFGATHLELFLYLMNPKDKYSKLSEIHFLTTEEVMKGIAGLTDLEMQALGALYYHGLRGSHLRDLKSDGHLFSTRDRDFLFSLIVEDRMLVSNAIAKIKAIHEITVASRKVVSGGARLFSAKTGLPIPTGKPKQKHPVSASSAGPRVLSDVTRVVQNRDNMDRRMKNTGLPPIDRKPAFRF